MTWAPEDISALQIMLDAKGIESSYHVVTATMNAGRSYEEAKRIVEQCDDAERLRDWLLREKRVEVAGKREENIYFCHKHGQDTPHDPSNAEHVAAWEAMKKASGF